MLSLIVPGYRDDSLKRKLDSLTQQSFSNFEVLVVVLERERERLGSLEQPWPFQLRFVVIPDEAAEGKYFISLKRNWGVKAAASGLYMFTDDDVLHTKDSLKTFADFFANGFCGIATCDLRFENDAVFRLGAATAPITDVKWMQLNGSLVVMDKATYQKVGTFKEDIRGRGGEDIDYGYRARHLGIAMKRLAGDWAIHEGAPRNDFATGKACGYGAYLTAQSHGQEYALALGVHPFSLALKSLAFRLELSRLFVGEYYKEYERGYLAGALEAREEKIVKAKARG
jgi:Glycosyltransferase like family 2